MDNPNIILLFYLVHHMNRMVIHLESSFHSLLLTSSFHSTLTMIIFRVAKNDHQFHYFLFIYALTTFLLYLFTLPSQLSHCIVSYWLSEPIFTPPFYTVLSCNLFMVLSLPTLYLYFYLPLLALFFLFLSTFVFSLNFLIPLSLIFHLLHFLT